MKVEITNPREKKFEPITLTITIETRKELLDMWVRHSISNAEIVKLVEHKDYRGNSDITPLVGKPALVAACQSIPDCALDVPLCVALKRAILG